MLSWTKLMKDLITLSGSTRKTIRKPERERRSDEQHGRIRYQKRKLQEQDAESEIQEYKRGNQQRIN